MVPIKARSFIRRVSSLSIFLIGASHIAIFTGLPLSAKIETVEAESKNGTVPQPFMNLFHDFTGLHDGTPTISQNLADALEKKEHMGADGPLILVIESGIYAYAPDSHKLVAKVSLRSDDPRSGFYELTSVSHIGPAIAYLAYLKQLNDPRWKDGLEKLHKDIIAVREVNAQQENNWLDKSSSMAMKAHREAVIAMLDYGCAKAADYIEKILKDDGKDFTPQSVSREFYNGQTKQFPIPFKNVMVGTFAVVALNDQYSAYQTLADKDIDWTKAKVLIQFHAGSNYGGGITKDSNHIYHLLRLISDNTLGEDRIFFTPYAQIRDTIGQDTLPDKDFNYYTGQVWYHQYARPKIAVSASFADVPSIRLPQRPNLPGDHNYSKADSIDDFMMRMKYSLGDNTQLLSNTIGFWMADELKEKGWNPAKVEVPGLTAGFPRGVTGYTLKFSQRCSKTGQSDFSN